MPKVFAKPFAKKHVELEFRIKQSKNREPGASTLSGYKNHNSFKFLVAVWHSGYIMFISYTNGGHPPDQFICKDSMFYDLFEPDDEVRHIRAFK